MIDLRVKGDQTKKRLIDACERLIAEKGFEGVSVRDITGMAKANVAAVNYHFGSREGLLDAVFSLRVKPLIEMRVEQLARLGNKANLRELFTAWASPLLSAEAAKGNDEVLHACLLGRCLEKLLSGQNESIDPLYRESERMLTDAMMRLLGCWQLEDVAWRLHFCHSSLVGGMIYGASLLQPFHRKVVIERWIDACIAQWGQSERTPRRGLGDRAKATESSEKECIQIAEVVSEVMSGTDAGAEAAEALPCEGIEPDGLMEPVAASSVLSDAAKTDEILDFSTLSVVAEVPPRELGDSNRGIESVMPTKGKKRKTGEDTAELFLF